MKVVILADSISTQNSGIHYFGLQLVKRLISSFPQHNYILISTEKIPSLEVEQIVVPLKKPPMHLRWRQLFTIPKRIKKMKPDCVIELAHFGPFNLPKEIKKVTVIHDLTPINYPAYHDRFSHIMHKLLMPGILSRADSIICNTIHTKKDIQSYQPELNTAIYPIYPKLALEEIDELKPDSAEYLLTIGTIEPRKNYVTLLKAFEKIGNQKSNLELVIIGKDGWKNEVFFSTLNKHPHRDRIHIKGYMDRSEMISMIKHCKLFVFPSLYEGFGIPIVEAMHFGKALVLSDIPTSKEIADDAAEFFPAASHDALAETIIRLLGDDKEVEKLESKSKKRYDEIQAVSDKQLLQWHNSILA